MSRDQAGVPLSLPLGRGTVAPRSIARDTQRDGLGTADLKSLARKVLERDTRPISDGTAGETGVPRPSTNRGTLGQQSDAGLDGSAERELGQTPGNALGRVK